MESVRELFGATERAPGLTTNTVQQLGCGLESVVMLAELDPAASSITVDRNAAAELIHWVNLNPYCALNNKLI